MFTQLDSRSAVPLYEQIALRLKAAVATGELGAGDALPSVRQLAARLRINPATVVQASRALEGEAFVEPRGGAGTFAGTLPGGRGARGGAARAGQLIRRLLAGA